MNEKGFQQKLIKSIKIELPDTFVKNIPGSMYMGGMPDLLIIHDGIFFAVELKFCEEKHFRLNKVTRNQLVHLVEIAKAGGEAWVFVNFYKQGEYDYIYPLFWNALMPEDFKTLTPNTERLKMHFKNGKYSVIDFFNRNT